MFGSEILEVGIGLAFIFFFASLVCSAVREGVEAFLKTRAQNLEGWLRENLTDRQQESTERGSESIIKGDTPAAGLTLAGFYEHSLIYPLFNGSYDKAAGRISDLPSYVPAKHFAGAILDLLAPADGKGRPALDQIADAAGKLQNERLKNVVLRAVGEANGDLDAARKAIESWYDQSMERLTGYYKRWTQVILIVLGALVAVCLNVDAIAISQKLLEDKATRSALVGEAARVQGQTYEDAQNTLGEIAKRVSATGLGLGYGEGYKPPSTAPAWMLKVAGWAATTFAIMLGAPFWFDLLNKLVSLRSAKKPEAKEDEGAAAEAK